MEVVTVGPGAEQLTRDLMHLFQEFRNEMLALVKDSTGPLKDDVRRVKDQLEGLRADHEALQKAFVEFKTKVGDQKQSATLPSTPEEVRVVSVSKSGFSPIPAKKSNLVVRIFCFSYC